MLLITRINIIYDDFTKATQRIFYACISASSHNISSYKLAIYFNVYVYKYCFNVLFKFKYHLVSYCQIFSPSLMTYDLLRTIIIISQRKLQNHIKIIINCHASCIIIITYSIHDKIDC